MSDNKIIEFFRKYGDGKTKICHSQWGVGNWVIVQKTQVSNSIASNLFWGDDQNGKQTAVDIVPEYGEWRVYEEKEEKTITISLKDLNSLLFQLHKISVQFDEIVNNS